MKMVTAPKMAELIRWITQVGISQEILSDQGMNFMSRMLKGICETFKIHHLRMSVYHPQTDGLVERFNYTLKAMIKYSRRY